jgi:RNA-directed DNA polymerase
MRGGYWAKPLPGHYIPGPDGRQWPLGIAALEDKVVKRWSSHPLAARRCA